MSQLEREPGTGVNEALDLLLKAPPERLRSLTHHLRPSAEEDIVHALCLFILQNEVEALGKLRAHGDNVLAKHLLEKWQKSTKGVAQFKVLCGSVPEPESLVTLARMFKVLTQHGLCDRGLLSLAYKRALPRESTDDNVLEYNQIMEEAKDVCGPDIMEILGTFNYLTLAPGLHSAATGSAQHCSKSNIPSSLKTECSSPSYPNSSQLEISPPPTDVPAAASSEGYMARSRSCPGSDCLQSHVNLSQGRSMPYLSDFKFPDHPKPTTPEPAANEETEQEEVTFYSFVILHALQDAEVAETMKEKLEKIIKSDGATFSNEFSVLGKQTLTCVEDAINNSAFTILLLTTNFNSFLEVKTNSALINAIDNKPKYNTVIPLLPQSNAMPRERLPMVLKTLIPLEENKHFEKKIKTALSPARISRQKADWMKEQEVKRLKERQEKLKISNQNQLRENEEWRAMQRLEQEKEALMNERYFVLQPGMGPDGRLQPQQHHPHINITNARYIIIGDNSQMAVDLRREAEHDEEN